MSRRLPVLLAVTVLASALLARPADASSTSAYAPRPPANPYVAASSGATMHGDSESSKAFAQAGPGTDVTVARKTLPAVCPTILAGSDGLVQALCTQYVGQAPRLYLVDPTTNQVLTALDVAKGTLLGGVYAYLDQANRLVIVDGHRQLLRIGHHRTSSGAWTLKVDASTSLTSAIASDDGVVGVVPDFQGRVWFATGHGTIGVVDTHQAAGHRVHVLHLPKGESVANSISSAPQGVAVTSTHAVYLLKASAAGAPQRVWRQAYDRSTARKPGQLSWGSGATPVFFGPASGSHPGTQYVTITDNARPHPHLLVLTTAASKGRTRVVCSLPVLTGTAQSGTEDAPVAVGRSVFVTDTYGYPYPKYPDGAGTSSPRSAPFQGGQTRVDVDADGTGCHTVWTTTTKSAGMPRLSTKDGTLYTVIRGGLLGSYRYATVDAGTGAVTSSRLIGNLLANPLEMTGTTLRDGALFQGTVSGFVRVSAHG